MAGSKTQFDAFLAEEVKRYKGITVPVKASLFQRILIHKMRWKKLHPNKKWMIRNFDNFWK